MIKSFPLLGKNHFNFAGPKHLWHLKRLALISLFERQAFLFSCNCASFRVNYDVPKAWGFPLNIVARCNQILTKFDKIQKFKSEVHLIVFVISRTIYFLIGLTAYKNIFDLIIIVSLTKNKIRGWVNLHVFTKSVWLFFFVLFFTFYELSFNFNFTYLNIVRINRELSTFNQLWYLNHRPSLSKYLWLLWVNHQNFHLVIHG